MSKTLRTTQLKTKSRLPTETIAKRSTTSIPVATTTTTKLSTKPKSIRNANATGTISNLASSTKPASSKEAIDTKLTSTRETKGTKDTTTNATKDTKLTPRTLTKTESNLGTKSKLYETNAIKAKTTADGSTTNRTQTTRIVTAAPVNKKVTSTASKNVTSKTNDQRNQPLRAKHTAAIVETVRKNTANLTASKSISKPNPVLDTYHSVTVASPPQQRKVREDAEIRKKSAEINTRPRTRTLDTDEVLILKSESAKLRSEKEVLENIAVEQQPKEPIAFEVHFEDQEKPTRDRSRSRSRPKTTTNNAERDSDEYADDFESYESDFETGSSSKTGSGTESSMSNSRSSSISSENDANDSESDTESGLIKDNAKSSKAGLDSAEEEEDEDESELTQFPITVIQRDKERERKHDSGHYEMPTRSNQKRFTELSQHSSQPMFEDSLDTFSAGASEQLDSGISSYGNAAQSNSAMPADAVTYGGYANFNTHPAMTKRGLELMSKISFDTLTFTLLDLKPITYDVFMQTFGKLNATQCSTQTQEQLISLECQTDDYETRSVWTQYPPQYDLSTMQNFGGIGSVQNCSGELPINELELSSRPRDQYEASLQALSLLRGHEDTRTVKQQLRHLHKPVDCERLNQFLLRSALVISGVLNANNCESNATQNRQLAGSNTALSAISTGYRQLDTHFLNALHVVRIFANAQHNLVITVHACRPDADVYRSDFSNLLMVWSASDTNAKPLRMLSTWSEVCRAELCVECADIVVCGLRDGSVALWDLRETYSFCSKLDGHLTHFAATQSIVPSLEDANVRKFTDIGAAVDVKSFRAAPKIFGLTNAAAGYKTFQFASLHDTGILTVWTLVETGKLDKTLENLSCLPRRGANVTAAQASSEYSSPWARVKLMQSAICDLRDYLERGIQKARSKFDKTKSLFQHNIYSDKVLRELNETQSEQKSNQELKGLRFTSIDAGCERVYVCTNRNFILACSKSLKAERFRRININESRFLFPTALRVLSNEEFLAVGLSNGSVMILNCNQNKNAALQTSYHAPSSPIVSTKPCSTPNQDYDLETGKSCAIQNIILNERRAFEPCDLNHAYEERPSTTAACLTMINEQKKPFELRVYDQQLLLSGSVLRKNLVQSLELSRDGWKLFALSDGVIRSYDFFLDREVVDSALTERLGEDKISDIAVASSGKNEQYLLMLQANDDVQLHLLKQ